MRLHSLRGGSEFRPPCLVADDLVPYDLRHTFCIDLQDAGVSINVAKELMGHSSIELTARIYTHYTEKSLNDAAVKMEQFRNKNKKMEKNKERFDNTNGNTR